MNLPAGPGGENLRYVINPQGASYLPGSHMPEGPGNNTERGVEQSPCYALRSPTSNCTLTVVGRGQVSVQGSHVDSQKSYDRVWGLLLHLITLRREVLRVNLKSKLYTSPTSTANAKRPKAFGILNLCASSRQREWLEHPFLGGLRSRGWT